MSKHQVYQKYAYFTMREIRDAMLDDGLKQDGYEPERKDDNCAMLDIEDIVNLQGDTGCYE